MEIVSAGNGSYVDQWQMDVRGSGTANENLQLLGADSMETISLA